MLFNILKIDNKKIYLGIKMIKSRFINIEVWRRNGDDDGSGFVLEHFC